MQLINEYWRKYQHTKEIAWLGKILDHYNLILFGVAMKYMKEVEMAKDVVQEVFLIALEHMPKTNIDNIGGWLYTVTKNEALKKLKLVDLQRNFKDLVQEEVSEDEVMVKAKKIEEKEQQLWKAIDELNVDQRRCIILFFIKNKSYQEIAATTSYTLKEVKSHLQNGKRNLKIKLGDHPLFH